MIRVFGSGRTERALGKMSEQLTRPHPTTLPSRENHVNDMDCPALTTEAFRAIAPKDRQERLEREKEAPVDPLKEKVEAEESEVVVRVAVAVTGTGVSKSGRVRLEVKPPASWAFPLESLV